MIKDEELRRGFIGKGFAQLLHDPGASRMAGDVKVKNTPSIVAYDGRSSKAHRR
jgi:hypothetical protein